MGAAVRGVVAMTRPTNVLMGMAGVLAGGLAAYGWAVSPIPLLLGAVCVGFGIAAGNTLNDSLDAAVDDVAHPDRAIPTGLVLPSQAMSWAAMWMACALAAAFLINLVAAQLACLLALTVVAYEAGIKNHGVAGNALVSVGVAGTFLMGAFAGVGQPLTYDSGQLEASFAVGRWSVALAMALLALLANFAREVFKDIQDAAGDGASRSTLPMVVGDGVARWIAAMTLAFASFFSLSLYLSSAAFGTWYLIALFPGITLFGWAGLSSDAEDASRRTKAGMLVCLVAFLSVGLL